MYLWRGNKRKTKQGKKGDRKKNVKGKKEIKKGKEKMQLSLP